MRKKVVLKVHRYQQKESECAVAACSSLAHFYNPEIKYRVARKQLPSRVSKNGLSSAEQVEFLNQMGLKNIALLLSDNSFFDFSWDNKSREWQIEKIKKMLTYCKKSSLFTESAVGFVQKMLSIIESDYNNEIIIDYDICKWVKSVIRKGQPIVATIDFTSFAKMTKELPNSVHDDIRGESVDHALVIRGFDESCVYVVDSMGRKTDYYDGYYKVKWEHFLVNAAKKDLVFVKNWA